MDDDQCKHLKEFYKGDAIFKLIRCKGIYPYEHIYGWEKFDEAKLSSKNTFHSKLNISDQGYEHAQQVRNRIISEFENVTLRDYHDVYLVIDVLLLADILKIF